jgi:hypothetical protein
MIRAVSRQATNTAMKPKNQGGGYITLGNIPPFRQDDLIAALWLAFCSEETFQHMPTNRLPAFFMDGAPSGPNQLENYLVSGRWDGAPAAHGPTFAAFTNDSSLFSAPIDRPLSVAVKPAVHQGYLQAEFSASDPRETEGVLLNREFTIRRYIPKIQDGKISETMLMYTINAQVTAVRKAAGLQSNGSPDILFAVQDHRFASESNKPSVGYLTKKDEWPDMENAMRTVQATFLFLIVALFVIVAYLKCQTLVKESAWLSLTDPVFPILTNRQVTWLALLFDAASAAYLLFGRNPVKKVAWLGGIFSAYHFAIFVLNPAAPCACLGGHAKLFGLSQSATTNLAIGSAVVMLLGGYGLLLARRLTPSRLEG